MHYHLEIIMPPVDDVVAAVEQIMQPFDENAEDEYGNRNTHTFWDFYVIGGRWAGAKLEAMLDPDEKGVFFDAIQEKGITVAGLTCGKQRLDPPVTDPRRR